MLYKHSPGTQPPGRTRSSLDQECHPVTRRPSYLRPVAMDEPPLWHRLRQYKSTSAWAYSYTQLSPDPRLHNYTS